jgi:hypothetical protein
MRETKRQLWTRLVIEQQKWIEEHGGDLAGYLANYHEQHGRTLDNARAIYEADLAELLSRERRLSGLR